MKVEFKEIDKVNGELTVVIEPTDYQEKVQKSIKEYAKKAKMPGFRPGMVPQGLIKKQYGVSILAEEVNKIMQQGLFDHIKENKINMLGDPISKEENNDIELVDGNTFTFGFELALAPEIKVSLSKRNKIEYNKVLVQDEMIKAQMDMYRQRGGSYEKVDSYQDNDMIKGSLTELNEDGTVKDGGVTAESGTTLPKYFRDEDQKKLFEGVKVGETVRFNPAKAYHDNEAELTSLLGVAKDDALNHKGDFNYEVKEISRYVPGPLTEELFEEVYPGHGIKTEEEFKAKIKEGLEAQYEKESDFRFLLDVKKYLTAKVGKLEYPEEKLRKIMLNNVDGDQKKVDDNFEKSLEELTWHLIKEQLVGEYGIKIDDSDVKNMAKEVTRQQFAQYGMLNIPEEYLEGSVAEMLKNRQTVDNLIDRAIELKLGAEIKEKVTLVEKGVTVEEFNKLFQ